MVQIILASTSPSRRRILEDLRLPFVATPPVFDEIRNKDALPADLALSNGMGKALSISEDFPPHHWVLGSDQVAFNDEGERFYKASSLEDAEHQLTRCAGHWLHFATSLAIVQGGTVLFKHVEQYSVKFRAMTPSAIRDYVLAEQPVGCAGSFKAETAGWRLFSDASGRDIRSLYGLPILALFDFADEQKVRLPYQGIDDRPRR